MQMRKIYCFCSFALDLVQCLNRALFLCIFAHEYLICYILTSAILDFTCNSVMQIAEPSFYRLPSNLFCTGIQFNYIKVMVPEDISLGELRIICFKPRALKIQSYKQTTSQAVIKSS